MLTLVSSNHLQDSLKKLSSQLDEKIKDLLPQPSSKIGEAKLSEAMRYSTLSSGKRLRPFMVVTSASLFGVGEYNSLQVAAAVEFIHAYSLIHDDLPALDNDDFRRGQPSCHKKFDEATAILAGDALLTMAFEVLSHPTTHADPAVRADLVLAFAEACGPKGMVGGQMIDLASDHTKLNMEEITRLQRMKTGALFAISCESGAILGKASRSLRQALRGYAHDIGLAFQITDDILDAELGGKGEKIRQDKSSEKGTYVSALGLDKAKMQAKLLSEQACSHLDVFGKKADLLKLLARFVVERRQ